MRLKLRYMYELRWINPVLKTYTDHVVYHLLGIASRDDRSIIGASFKAEAKTTKVMALTHFF